MAPPAGARRPPCNRSGALARQRRPCAPGHQRAARSAPLARRGAAREATTLSLQPTALWRRLEGTSLQRSAEPGRRHGERGRTAGEWRARAARPVGRGAVRTGLADDRAGREGTAGDQRLDRRFGLVRSYRRRLDYDLIERPHYGHCLLHAATLARKLGHPRVSAIEFGVAGGNGLVALERHAEAVRAETGVEVAIFGFDTGRGMPPPRDYRDMPYMWQAGYFEMDEGALRARLRSARLILGDVAETLPGFAAREGPPPIGG